MTRWPGPLKERGRTVPFEGEGSRIEDGKNRRDIFRVLTLSRIERNGEWRLAEGAPVAHNKALRRLWPCTVVHARDTHTRVATHRRPTRLEGTTAPFQHFRVVRLMNRLLFLPPSIGPRFLQSTGVRAYIYRRYRFDRYRISSAFLARAFRQRPLSARIHEDLVPCSLCRLRSRSAFSIESFDSIMARGVEQGGTEQVRNTVE